MIKFVDMFSGIGGFREGLTRAGGFECVGHCEIDKYANRSYNALFDTKGEWFIEDARKADPSTMPDFQLLCGGFPCQTFSIAGTRKGFGDPRGTLFFELARLAEARKPPYTKNSEVYMKLNHNKKSVKISLNLFALYAVMVCGIVFALPAFAADDPLVVVENLSTFIFSLIRAVGLILLGWGIVQVGLSLQSHDPSQRSQGFLTLAGGLVITFAKEILDLITA